MLIPLFLLFNDYKIYFKVPHLVMPDINYFQLYESPVFGHFKFLLCFVGHYLCFSWSVNQNQLVFILHVVSHIFFILVLVSCLSLTGQNRSLSYRCMLVCDTVLPWCGQSQVCRLKTSREGRSSSCKFLHGIPGRVWILRLHVADAEGVGWVGFSLHKLMRHR